jgi:hypothetical protein
MVSGDAMLRERSDPRLGMRVVAVNEGSIHIEKNRMQWCS